MSINLSSVAISDIIRWEVNPSYSREKVTVVAATDLKRGTVLGIKTADKKFYPSVSGATDGTENAVAILLDDLEETAGKSVPVLRRTALIIAKNLVWDASYDLAAEKTAALANLASASGIVTAEAI